MAHKKIMISKKHAGKLNEIGRLIFRFLSKNSEKSFNYKQIAQGVEYRNPRQREQLIQSLHLLRKEGKIKEESTGKYQIQKLDENTLEGIIDFNSAGNAYVRIEGQDQDVFVHQKNVKNALQGDTVRISLVQFKGKKTEGAVIEIIERKRTQFVGTLQYREGKDFGFVVCERKQINTDIFVSKTNFLGAENDNRVLVEITNWREGHKNPDGKIIRVLGEAGNHETEIHSILAEYSLPYEFPQEVEHEAEQIDKRILPEEIAKRRDMRSVLTFTIDPKDAKDFDDALSLQKLENGNWEIGVHIADVSHYVRPGTLLDDEAYQRATSVYLIDRVVPMLPEVLSNQVCSLRPEEEKFTFSAVFELNDKAEIVSKWFGRTVIYSDRRFTYEEAQERIETGQGDLAEEILTLNSLSKILREKRIGEGAITFDRSEVRFNLDEQSNPIGVYFKVSKDANHLIEEFMLLANKKVSEFVSLNQKLEPSGNTFVYRIHDDPDPTKLKTLQEFVSTFGYTLDISNPKNISKSMNRLLAQVKGKPEENMIETLAMRSMSKAIYTTENIGHYGLSFEHYSHFTSPIRRYPDLIAHRLLQHYLDKGKSTDQQTYEVMCKHCSSMERKASDAERDSIKFMQVKFMEKHVGEVFQGVISGVTEWGIYVEIPENGAEGLIRLRDLTDDSYRYEAKMHAIVGSKNGKMYQLGSAVFIKVVRANLVAKQLDFQIVEMDRSEE